MKKRKTMFSKTLAYLLILAMLVCAVPAFSASATSADDGFVVPTAADKLASANTWPGTIDLTEVDNGLKFTTTLNQFNTAYNVGLRNEFNLYDLTLNFHGTIDANYFSVRFNSIGYGAAANGEWGPDGIACLRIFTFFDMYGVYYRTKSLGADIAKICDGATAREGLVDKDWSYRFIMNSDGSLTLKYYISGNLCGEGIIPKTALDEMNINPSKVYLSFGLESGDTVSAESSVVFTGYKMSKITKTPVYADFLSTANTWSSGDRTISVTETDEGVDIIPRGDDFERAYRVGLRKEFSLKDLELDFKGHTNENYFDLCLTSTKYGATEWPDQSEFPFRICINPDVGGVYFGYPNSWNDLCGGIPNRTVFQSNKWGFRFSINDDGSLKVKIIFDNIVAGEGTISKAVLDANNINPNSVYVSFCLESGHGNNITDGKFTFTGYTDFTQNFVSMNDMLRTCNDWSSQNLTVSDSAKGVAINVNTCLDSANFLEYNMGAKTKFSLRDLTLNFNNYLKNNYFSVRFHSGGYNENEGIAGGKSDLRIFMLHDLYQLFYRSYNSTTDTTDESLICGEIPRWDGVIGKNWSYHFSMNNDGSLHIQYITNGNVISEGDIPKVALDAVGINPDKVYLSFGFESGEGGELTSGTVYYTGYSSSVAKTVETIGAIGTVTMKSRAIIDAARTLYNCVPTAQKNLVTNYATLTAAEAAFASILGDLNANGTVADSGDLVIVRKAILGAGDATDCDINDDGKVNLLDLVALKKLSVTPA